MMNTETMKSRINSIMFSGARFGLKIFACIKEEEKILLKKFKTDDELRENVCEMLELVVGSKFVPDDIELDAADNIADKRKVLYEIVQDDQYSPFSFITEQESTEEVYTENDQGSLFGFMFRISKGDKFIWAYQHVYPVRIIKRSKSLYAMITEGDTYVTLDRDVMKIDSRIDLILIDNSIITANISLMQQSFGFEKYIRGEAEKTIAIIDKLGIVSDIKKFFAFEDKPSLTNAKKLLKAKGSPVLNMTGTALIDGLKNHKRYSTIFVFDEDKIAITSQKDVGELIKMLNDDIVRSELTNQEYDSSAKHILEPLATT